MKKVLLKISVAAALTLGFTMLTTVDAQAQTKTERVEKGSTILPVEVAPNGEVILGGSGTEEDPYLIGEPGNHRPFPTSEDEHYPIWWNGGVTGGGLAHTFWYLNL